MELSGEQARGVLYVKRSTALPITRRISSVRSEYYDEWSSPYRGKNNRPSSVSLVDAVESRRISKVMDDTYGAPAPAVYMPFYQASAQPPGLCA